MTFPRLAPGSAAQCTWTDSFRSTAITEPQGTRWSRSGFCTVMPAESAITRGRNAHAYTSPVTNRSVAAISTAVWLRPVNAMSARTTAARISQAHQATMAPGSRNVLGSLSGAPGPPDRGGAGWADVGSGSAGRGGAGWAADGSGSAGGGAAGSAAGGSGPAGGSGAASSAGGPTSL